jgi:glutamate synthase (NADPH/NADH) large chain
LALKRALDAIRSEVSKAIAEGARIIVLSDRNSDDVYAPIPSLLLTAAVHHHLIREQQRTKVGLVVECGDAREVHHMALLVGYGAGAINPYLAFESIEDMIAQDLHGLGGMDPHGEGAAEVHQGRRQGRAEGDEQDGRQHGRQLHRRADLRGHRPRSRPGRRVLHRHRQPFGGHRSRRGRCRGGGAPHRGHPRRPEERAYRKLELGGEYQWRREGDIHLFNPETVFKLQHATRAKRYDIFQQYTALVDGLSKQAATLRGLFELAGRRREPVHSTRSSR